MKQYLYEQFTATRLFNGELAYSPDAKQIAYIDNTSGQFNLWIIPSGGGYARQITSFEDHTVRSLKWSADGKQIAFTADENGSEFRQVFIIDSAGGWPIALTQADDAQHSFGDWAPHSNWVAYTSNEHEPTQMDTILHNIETGERKSVMTGNQYYADTFSPDGKYLSVVNFISNTDQNIFILEVESGEAMLASPHEGESQFFPMAWSADSSGFYFASTHEREFRGIAYYDLKSGQWEWTYTPDKDVDLMAISKDGQRQIFIVNQDGSNQLVGKDLKTQSEIPLPDLPLGVIYNLSLSADGQKLAFVMATPKSATNLYEIDLETGELTTLGQSMLGGINPDDLIEPELIHYESWDGKMIPAWLYRPKNTVSPRPMVLSIHGGPEAQERPIYNYNGMYQYLLNRGIAVLAPNIRGSSGYGVSYQKLIHRDWGGGELKDIEFAAKYMQGLDWVDSKRLAVFGGSFGGFATLSAVSRLADYWAVGVDLVGPSNLLTFVKSVPPHWRHLMKTWVGDPEEDYDLLIERSPISYVDQIKAPLLVIQGANDPRVVKAESDQMVERIQKRGGDVTYYVDPEEGHGAARRKNMLHWYRMVCEYLEAHLIEKA